MKKVASAGGPPARCWPPARPGAQRKHRFILGRGAHSRLLRDGGRSSDPSAKRTTIDFQPLDGCKRMADGPITLFSRRHGYRGPDRDITVREDAPGNRRCAVVQIAEELGLTPHFLRSVVCRVLHRRPLTEVNRSAGNVRDEVFGYIENCDWFKVYDIVEAIHRAILGDRTQDPNVATEFGGRINQFFGEEGIGWQLVNGEIQVRGDEAFEAIRRAAGGREPEFVEAELVVGLSASLATYLAKRLQGQ